MHAKRLGLTSVVFHSAYQGPVGYFTLANDSIPLKTSEAFDLDIDDGYMLPSFPAVKIGRFAIAKPLQGDGVGSAVLKLVFGEVLDSRSLSSSRLLIVDADNDPLVIKFYGRHGFEKSLWAESQAQNHGGRGAPTTVKMLRDVLA
jgi:ribosomal protein S18 acetylase RimI-like enzyme